jgi:hypothetical protein
LKTPTLPSEATANGQPAHKSPQPVAAQTAQGLAAGVGISQDQWSELRAALKGRAIPERKLLAHFQVSKPRELPAVRFAEALALIRAPESVLLKK